MSGAAVYRLYGSENRLLYVGMSTAPLARMEHHARNKAWWDEVVGYTLQWLPTEKSALTVESRAILNERPVYNVTGNPGPRMVRMEVYLTSDHRYWLWKEQDRVPGRVTSMSEILRWLVEDRMEAEAVHRGETG